MCMMLTCHVKPGSSENRIQWLSETEAKVWLTAAPEKGKANKALIDMLAKDMGVAKSLIQIKYGKTAKVKTIEITT